MTTLFSSISVVDVSDGASGSLGYTVDISGYTAFSENAGGAFSPATTTLNAITTNINSPTYSWSITGATPTSSTNSSVTITPSSSASYITASLTVNGSNMTSPITKNITMPIIYDGAPGQAGANGYMSAFPTIYIWTNSATPPARPSTTSTYTWSTGFFTPPTSWSVVAPNNTAPGNYLWSITIPVNTVATTTTSSLDWTDTQYPIRCVSYNGANGTNGTNGTDGSNGAATFVVVRTANDSSPPTNAEVQAVISRDPVAGDICTVSYNNYNNATVYKYTASWILFQTYITGSLIVQNTITADKMVTGLMSADNTLTRNLTVRDNSGNIILSSGTPLNYTNINPASSWLNGNISINSNGTLSGAGSGQVSLSGLGYTGATNATKNNIYYQSATPSSPSTGDIWIDTTNSAYIVKTYITNAWYNGATYTTNTNQLTDGAGLGTTAVWSSVTGTGKPADNATKNIVTYSSTAPASPTNGDIWVDTTTSTYIIKVYYSNAWSISSNYITNTNQISDGAGLGTTAVWSSVSGTGKPADNATKNVVTYSGTAPSSPTAGDIWINTTSSAYVLSVYSGTAWQTSSNYTTNTNQLTDGAGLGTTAVWSSVSGANKPADNATRNIVTYSSSAPAGPVSGDIWVDTTTSTYIIKVYIGSTWQVSSNYITNTNQITDGAGLGTTATWSGVTGANKPADNATKNIVTYSSTAPSSPTAGDIWVDTTNTAYIVKVYISGNWLASSNYTTNTNQLTDGASLGSTAVWSSVSSRPANLSALSGTEAIQNSLITITSDGKLSGAGSGQVTLGGLGAGGFALLNQITSANASTYIAGAAIGTAQVGVLTANNIGAGTIDASKIAAGTIWTNDLQVGSSPAISGTTMTGSGTRAYSDGRLVSGNSQNSLVFDGTTLYLNLPFLQNPQTISQSASVASGSNAVSVGPITVANTAVITVPTGSVWTVV